MASITVHRAGRNPQTAEVRIDDDVHDLLTRRGWNIGLSAKGYAQIRMPLHHFVYGKPKGGNVIDHINGDRGDCRRANLREITPHQNMQNNHGRQFSRHGLRGIVETAPGRFSARGRVNGVTMHSKGTYPSAREAHAAYLRLVQDAGSMLDLSAPDIDARVLIEFPARDGNRRKADESLPAGVTKSANGKRFRASIRRKGVVRHLGTFSTAEEARQAFLDAAQVTA